MDADTPKAFAVFNHNNADECLRYDAKWVPQANGRKLVVKKLPNKNRVSTDGMLYFFVRFGPAEVVPDTGRRMKKIMFRVKGKNIFTGKTIDEEILMTQAHDPKVGTYYWGNYMPKNCSKDPMTMSIEISAKDAGAHLLEGRKVLGDDLDSNPALVPYVDTSGLPKLPWKDYSPGSDTAHKFTIAPLEWGGFSTVFVPIFGIPQEGPKLPETAPQGRPQTIPKIGKEGFFALSILQLHRDCQWEKKKGPISCPVTWKIESKLKNIEKVSGGMRIRPNRRICKPGVYPISITCKLGALVETKVVKVRIL